MCWRKSGSGNTPERKIGEGVVPGTSGVVRPLEVNQLLSEDDTLGLPTKQVSA